MASLFTLINKLLPFATPGTPLVQDLLHLAALCTALYYAPQIQAYIQDRSRNPSQDEPHVEPEAHNVVPEVQGQVDQPTINGNRAAPPQPFVQDASDSENDISDNDDQIEPGFADFNGAEDNAGEGPANGAPGPAAPRPTGGRTVGAKKAKSLARRDQRRAYHEFMRSQGEAQRARDAAGAEEREAQLTQERARRAAAEAELEIKRAKEREEKRVKEEKAREQEARRRESVVQSVRDEVQVRGFCDLEEVAARAGVQRDWVEGLVRASGILNPSDGSRTMITGTGWVVRVESRDMEALYSATSDGGNTIEEGTVSYSSIGKKLEDVLRKKDAVA